MVPAQAGKRDLVVESVAAAMPNFAMGQPSAGDALGDGRKIVLMLKSVRVKTTAAPAGAEVKIEGFFDLNRPMSAEDVGAAGGVDHGRGVCGKEHERKSWRDAQTYMMPN